MKRHTTTIAALAALALGAGSALAQTTSTYTGGNKTNGDNWNNAGNWDNSIPTGAIDVVIPATKLVTAASAATLLYSGNLSIETDALLQIGYTDGQQNDYNALGTPGTTIISMGADSRLYLSRVSGDHIIPAIQMLGDILIKTGQSTNTPPDLFFDHGITVAFTLTFNGKSNSEINLTAVNSFTELIASPTDGSGYPIYCLAAGSLGGDVTVLAAGSGAICANLFIGDSTAYGGEPARDVMADTGTLSLNGSGATLLTMNQDDTIADLLVNGVVQPGGTYGATGSGADFEKTGSRASAS